MFIVKFNQTTGAPFKADKNGNFPLIGTLLAGKSRNSIINGTIAERENVQAGKLYLCQNTESEYEGTTQVNLEVISEVSPIELVGMIKQLGNPVQVKAESVAEVDEPAIV